MISQDNPEIPVSKDGLVLKTAQGIAYIPALVSGLICVGLIRSGFLSFFFLVPLGVMAYSYNLKSGWLSVFLAILGNSIFSLGAALFSSGALLHPWLDVVYFALIMAAFTWITAPPFRNCGFFRFSIGYRFIAASVIGALGFLGIIKIAQTSFDTFLRSQGELLSSLYIASAGTDVVQQALLEAYITPDAIIDFIGLIMFRGGGIASWALIFFINRQISLVFSRVTGHTQGGGSIIHFHVSPGLIWVLSFSLLGVLLGKWTAFLPLEILAWNMISICVILYLAQGGGILGHFLSRRALPFPMRFALSVLIIMLIISPGINLVTLGALLLLGIAEHWAPFRTPKSDGPSSTPGM